MADRAEGVPYLAGEGILWYQEKPNAKPELLGCHMLGDVDEPLGDVTLLRCRDVRGTNKWRIVGTYQEAPDLVTSSIETDLGRVADFLELANCPFAIFAHKTKCGRQDVFNNYQRSFLLGNTYITSRGMQNMVMKDEQDRSTQSFDISAEPPIVRLFELIALRQSTSEPRALNTIALCGEDRCANVCGVSSKLGDVLAAAGDSASGSASGTANVLRTTNGGGLWAATATDPFGTSANIAALRCFAVERDTTRILAARLTADAGPLDVAYSDDNGATWTEVVVGSVNGQTVMGSQGMMVIDEGHIYLAASDGYIYFSEDGGETWEAQESGALTTEDLYAIRFSSFNNGWAVGDNGVILRTIDGGVTWSAVTSAPENLRSVGALDNNRAWFGGGALGRMYYTEDGGDTINRRKFKGDGSGSVAAMDWYNDYFGVIVHNTTAPAGRLLYTINGGWSWRAMSVPTNTGLNDIAIAGTNLAFAVGEVQGGTAVILKVQPTTSLS